MATTRIDVGGGSFLPICQGCGWRGLPGISRQEALQEARHHERRAHPGDEQTRAALGMHETRQARRHTGTIR